MKLLTGSIRASLPPLYSQENVKDPIVHAKFFTPWSNLTWFAMEYEPADGTFFGWVVGHEEELGYFSLDELESLRGPGGIGVERDIHFTPKPLSRVKAEYERQQGKRRNLGAGAVYGGGADEAREAMNKKNVANAPGSDLPRDIWNSFLETALWSSNYSAGDDGEFSDPRGLEDGDPLDKEYSPSDIDEEGLVRLAEVVRKFLKMPGVKDAIIVANVEYGQDDSRIGRDLWLTTQGHGAGYWDGDYGDEKNPNTPAHVLTKAARSLRHEFYLMPYAVGDDPADAKIEVA